MNIFYLDPDADTCARYHCDKHVGKMMIESAQLLSTAHHEHDSGIAPLLYRPGFRNHPSAIWARTSIYHYQWLYRLYVGLIDQWQRRRGTPHLGGKLRNLLVYTPAALTNRHWSDPPQCMPDKFKHTDCVTAYRNFYIHDKPFARYELGVPAPAWFRLGKQEAHA